MIHIYICNVHQEFCNLLQQMFYERLLITVEACEEYDSIYVVSVVIVRSYVLDNS